MITIEQPTVTKDRLMDLEKTVAQLDDRLRNIQSIAQHARAGSLVVRFLNLVSSKQERVFMSAVCNRPIRPNTKVTSYDGPRA